MSDLIESRRKSADLHFESSEIEGIEHAENGWNEDGVYFSKKIFWEGSPSRVGSYGVEFAVNSDEIAAFWTN